jgi:hypothetical protein
MPHEQFALQFSTDYNRDQFDNSILGLQQGRSHSFSLDGAYTVGPHTTLHAFYTRERFSTDQRGRSFTPATRVLDGQRLQSPTDWFTTMRDRIDTIGAGAKLARFGPWGFGAEYTYSYGVGQINTMTGPGIATAGVPLPDLVTRLNALQLYTTYAIRRNATIRLSWWHQRLRTSDWAYDAVSPNTMANVLATGQLPPNYSVNVVGLSVAVRYW